MGFPRMLAAGLRGMAVLMPRNAVATMNLEDMLGKAPGTKLKVAYFATVEAAREWLTKRATNLPIVLEAKSIT